MTTRLILGWVLLAGCAGGLLRAEVPMPGTQPREAKIDYAFFGASNCKHCHARTDAKNGPADPYFSWSGGMMAQAARDPVFRAALAIANQDIPDVGDFCIRCHSLRGWLAGRSSVTDGSALEREDLHGVSCSVCHRLIDPRSVEARKVACLLPPGDASETGLHEGNGMVVVDPEDVARGPYPDPGGIKPHHLRLQSPYQASSRLCGNCHNVSNPTLAHDVTNQPPHTFGHIERTYSEWALSDFARGEQPRTCQSCHFPRVAGGGQAVYYDADGVQLHRDYFVEHGATGGSTWVQDAIYLLWKGKDLDRAALEAGKERARAFLKTAAALGLELSGGQGRLTITNLTGHKLPTGYPEGRRMWINVRFLDRNAKLLGELGRYGDKPDTLENQPVTVPTLLDTDRTRVYECQPGLSQEQAQKYKTAPGPSFHFVLNDRTVKDNRIPPRGFTRAAFASHVAAPVGADYADGQYWDTFEFALPAGTEQVEARLQYQSVSWEYLKFLVEENRNKTNSWGRRLYEAWEVTGKCPPQEMAFVRSPSHP